MQNKPEATEIKTEEEPELDLEFKNVEISKSLKSAILALGDRKSSYPSFFPDLLKTLPNSAARSRARKIISAEREKISSNIELFTSVSSAILDVTRNLLRKLHSGEIDIHYVESELIEAFADIAIFKEDYDKRMISWQGGLWIEQLGDLKLPDAEIAELTKLWERTIQDEQIAEDRIEVARGILDQASIGTDLSVLPSEWLESGSGSLEKLIRECVEIIAAAEADISAEALRKSRIRIRFISIFFEKIDLRRDLIYAFLGEMKFNAHGKPPQTSEADTLFEEARSYRQVAEEKMAAMETAYRDTKLIPWIKRTLNMDFSGPQNT